jgi:hypothetical protein
MSSVTSERTRKARAPDLRLLLHMLRRGSDRRGRDTDSPATILTPPVQHNTLTALPIAIDEPSPYAEVESATLALAGWAPAGCELEVRDWMRLAGRTRADEAGRWSLTLHGLEEGEHLVVVRAAGAGDEEPAASVTLTVLAAVAEARGIARLLPWKRRVGAENGAARKGGRGAGTEPGPAPEAPRIAVREVARLHIGTESLVFALGDAHPKKVLLSCGGAHVWLPLEDLQAVADAMQRLAADSARGVQEGLVAARGDHLTVEVRDKNGLSVCRMRVARPDGDFEVAVPVFMLQAFARGLQAVIATATAD